MSIKTIPLFVLSILLILMTDGANAAGELSLKQSIGLAARNNPSILSAGKKAEAAKARLDQAIGAFFPTVKIDGSIGRSYSQPSEVQITTQTSTGATTQNMSFGTDAAQDSKSLQASLSQPLFVAALLPGYKIAQKSADLAKEELKKAELDTAYNVAQAYFGVLKSEKMVKLAEESRTMARSHLSQVNSLLSAGVATQADFLRAEVQSANADVALTRAKNGLEIAYDAFNNALGRDLEEKVILVQEGFTGKVANLPTYKDLLAKAYGYRPDWKLFLLGKDISTENLRVAQTAYLPSVMLSASTGNRITEYPSYKSDVNSWAVTGMASWTLFDGLGIQNRIKEAAANLEAQKALQDQVSNGIALDVRNAYLNLTGALETVEPANKAVRSAEEGYKVSSLRFASGIGTNLEVLDAQVSLTQARINYLQTLFDVETAKAKINNVVGSEVL